jgi:hypothetical protein
VLSTNSLNTNHAIVKIKKRPHWEGAGAAKGYPAEHKFLIMNARRHQSDTRVTTLKPKEVFGQASHQVIQRKNNDSEKQSYFWI